MAALPKRKDEEPAAQIDVTGSEAVSTALLDLLNRFPGLRNGERIRFAALDDAGGLGFFPGSGAVIRRQTADILGTVLQVCQYPFDIVYRAAPRSEEQRLRMKEFLDTVGNWLDGQPVTVGGVQYRLTAYPALESGNRVIRSIERTAPAALNRAYEDTVEDWIVSSVLTYQNEFKKTMR